MNLEIKETKKKITYDDILNTIQSRIYYTHQTPQIKKIIKENNPEITKKTIVSQILEKKKQQQLEQERIKIMKPRNMNFT
jgi:hypothetical protein